MVNNRRQLGAILHDKGVDFAVWAPSAKKVILLLWMGFDWKEVPMQPDKHGNWYVDDVDVKPGQSYKYRIITQDDRVLEKNDPYARQLTDSENGFSVVVVRDFEWESAGHFQNVPIEQALIYELHVGTFNRPDASTRGTFETVIQKLDYLKELGVNYIELMPVTSMATHYGWGYAPNYIFSVEDNYGGRHGLLDLVKNCHEKGIGVMLDVVYNHFYGADLWQYDGWSEDNRGGIYFYNDERGDTPWGGRPDYGRPEVRQFILDNIKMWLTEFKIDGLRLDSTLYMRNTAGQNADPKHDIPEAWSLMQEINSLARKINPQALLVAEDNSTTDAIVDPVELGGAGFDAQWELGFPHVIRDALGITSNSSQSRLDGIAWGISHAYTPRVFDRVVFSDSHDTAANGGARLNEEASPGNAENAPARQCTIIASALALTSPGIPMLLQGQEFMQEGSFNDWQMLEWSKTDQFSGIVTAHKHLIDLRMNRYGNTAGLLGKNTEIIHRNNDNNIIAYRRWDKGGPRDETIVVVNLGKDYFEKYDIHVPTAGEWRVRFNSSWNGYSKDFHEVSFDVAKTTRANKLTIKMPPFGVLILSQD